MKIYATDLDRTIMFSDKFLTCANESLTTCVEYLHGRPISHMTKKALASLESLKRKKNLLVVPVTTRSVAQFRRVAPVQDCQFAIMSNGGTILQNGCVFEPWREHVKCVVQKYQEGYAKIGKELLTYSDCFEKEAVLVDGLFFFVKLPDDQTKIDYVTTNLELYLDKRHWVYTIQGLKLYILPREISKESALRFLKGYLGATEVVTSGDGKLDYGFLKLGDVCIIPESSEVLDYISEADSDFKWVSVEAGLEGTEALFDIVLQTV